MQSVSLAITPPEMMSDVGMQQVVAYADGKWSSVAIVNVLHRSSYTYHIISVVAFAGCLLTRLRLLWQARWLGCLLRRCC